MPDVARKLSVLSCGSYDKSGHQVVFYIPCDCCCAHQSLQPDYTGKLNLLAEEIEFSRSVLHNFRSQLSNHFGGLVEQYIYMCQDLLEFTSASVRYFNLG